MTAVHSSVANSSSETSRNKYSNMQKPHFVHTRFSVPLLWP